MPYGIMIYSLCANNRDENIHLYVFTDESFTNDDKISITKVLKSFNNDNKVDFIYITLEMINDVIGIENECYPRQTYYRLLMSRLLPTSVNKILYLDGDIIVRGSLKDLWNINIDNVALAAVPDAGSGILEVYNRLGMSIALGYFNAGVMLVNVEYWRKYNLQEKMFAFLKNNKDKITLGDQDTVNYILRDIKTHLPLKYNVQTMFLYKFDYICFSVYQYKQEFDEAIRNPVILHFSGCRPWERNCQHPYKEEFYKYQEQTIWKDVPLKKVRKSFRRMFTNIVRRILTIFGICHYDDYFDRTLKIKN
jgi:lipopolysaccharide biosynthesis glycosyltransferase